MKNIKLKNLLAEESIKPLMNKFNSLKLPQNFKITNKNYDNRYDRIEILITDDSTQIEIFIVKNKEKFSLNGFSTYEGGNGRKYATYRVGVESSFYIDDAKNINDLLKKTAQELVDEVEKINRLKEETKNYVKVPDTPFSVDKNNIDNIKKKLKANGHYTFEPSGFGHAYMFTTKAYRQPRSKRASAEQEKFFGISPLFVDLNERD